MEENEQEIMKTLLPKDIFREWTHSFEEDVGDIQVFRPTGYDFIPSRMPRDGYDFKKNGEVVLYVPGPTDATQAIEGRFKTRSKGKVIELFFDDRRTGPYSLEILLCNERMLKIRKLA